jgi:hypothetical protein
MSHSIITADQLAANGLTPEDVRHRYPLAVEYGPPSAPYWQYKDLVEVFRPDAEGRMP